MRFLFLSALAVEIHFLPITLYKGFFINAFTAFCIGLEIGW